VPVCDFRGFEFRTWREHVYEPVAPYLSYSETKSAVSLTQAAFGRGEYLIVSKHEAVSLGTLMSALL